MLKSITKQESLQNLYPVLAAEWHPTKNGILSPGEVKPNTCKEVWWLCPKGHSYKTMINYRAIRNWGCPYCSGRKANQENCLQTVYPDLAKQWHPNKNGTLTPDQVGPNSTLKVWWRCQAGHEWEARVVDQAKNKKGCAICLVRPKDPENCLMATHPSLAKEWHSINNTSLSPRVLPPILSRLLGGFVKKEFMEGHYCHENQRRIGVS